MTSCMKQTPNARALRITPMSNGPTSRSYPTVAVDIVYTYSTQINKESEQQAWCSEIEPEFLDP